MVQKLMIDEKKCYFFGRNKQMCDFCIDHASCSRVHSALVWHKHLGRPFIIDLGSTHGTYIGHIRLEKRKPQQVPIDSELHFGASTRLYIIRERPQPLGFDDKDKSDVHDGSLLGLPETETELDNLTEFNTATNRRVTSVVEGTNTKNPLKRKKKGVHISFNDDEEVINPEDIDPSVGRFRNLVHTTVIPSKRAKIEHGLNQPSMTDSITKRLQNFTYGAAGLYGDLPSVGSANAGSTLTSTFSVAAKLGLSIPNLAPDLDPQAPDMKVPELNIVFTQEDVSKEPRKKKYAKEAWPGKKPVHNLLV